MASSGPLAPTPAEVAHFFDLDAVVARDELVATPLRLLFLADSSHVASVVQDHISSIELGSRHQVTLRNPIEDAAPPSLDGHFDAVLIHYSIYILGDYYLPREWASCLRRFGGVKAQIIQDEHRFIDRMKRRMRELGIRLVFSSLDVENMRRVYGAGGTPGGRYCSTLPGYVPRRSRTLVVPPHWSRPFDIVYRGRTLPPHLGRDAQMKAGIGKLVAPMATRKRLLVDISSEEHDRIYGDAWESFLMSSRATLACEGGASIFDFDGSIARATERFVAKNPGAGFEEIWRNVLAPHEGNVVHRTITPKIFEAIATRTTLVLFPGRYRDILTPERHFISLEPDGSNLDEVIDKLRDRDFVEEIADRAWREVLQRPDLRFDAYVDAIDRLLAEEAERQNSSRDVVAAATAAASNVNATIARSDFPADAEVSASAAEPLAGKRLLVAYSNASTFTTTTLEYVESFRRFGSAEVHYLHVSHAAEPEVDLDAYDAVLLSYCARLCFSGYVSEHFLRLLDRYDGVKAVAIQDEYDYVEQERQALDRLSPDLVFTCVPPSDLGRVYPPIRYPRTEFVQVLTGYVPSSVPRDRRKPVAGRPIAIGYRGRSIGSRYGRLADMKQRIGEVFREECTRRGIAGDVAVDEASRIYGDAWYQWLANCRCVLGTESGSNVFDFDGSIAAACRESQLSGEPLPESIRARIEELDETFHMGQVSPRVFEAALLGTPMALYLGQYSNVLQPYVHYIPIEHDHSNLDEVFDLLKDDDTLQRIADKAYDDLIASGEYEYSRFVSLVERHIGAKIRPAHRRAAVARAYPPTTPADLPPLLERPTTGPRPYDSFQLRMLRSQLEGGVPATRVLVSVARRSQLFARLERRVRASHRVKIALSRLRKLHARAGRLLHEDGPLGRLLAATRQFGLRVSSTLRPLVTPNYATLDMQGSAAYRLWRGIPESVRARVRPAAYWLQRWNALRWIFGKG